MPENFEIAYPWVFALIPLPLLVVWLLPPLKHRKTALVAPFFERSLTLSGKKATKGVKVSRRGIFRWTLLGITWLLLLAAASSPQLVGEPELKVKNSRSFLIAADLSFSMATKDWVIDGQRSTRWEAVKEVMKDFIERREGDRMGLVFFGTNAYLQAPFTPDLEMVQTLLEDADVGMAGQQTSIGKAIGKSMELFQRDTIEHKVMLLLTDGVDAGNDVLPLDAASLAKEDSVIIYTIGIGDPNARGSDLDEKTLTEIAELTGGQYFRAIDADRLEQIYAELDQLEPIEYEEETYKPTTLLYFYPLGLMLLLTLGVQFISELFKWLLPRKKE